LEQYREHHQGDSVDILLKDLGNDKIGIFHASILIILAQAAVLNVSRLCGIDSPDNRF
jgi:hypothetical protein